MDEALRTCARCRLDKPLSDFGRKRLNDFQPYRRPCQSEYKKEHYQGNEESYLASGRKRLGKLRELVRQAKDKPCTDCGVKYPYYVMDFDHRNGDEKLAGLGQLMKRHSEASLIDEMAKCDLVCANCHRERTHQRGQSVSKKYREPTDSSNALL